jgi:cell division protein FtsA
MSSDQIFVGLEIGTTKICVVVAEGRSEDQISILGVGETPSRGIRKGEIVDMATAAECVREAILDAEEKTNVEIGNVWVAISGGHLRSLNNRGIHVLPHPRQIEQEDLDQVQTNAKEIAIPPQNIFLHTILQSYHLDGNRNVIDPLESEGMQLEADFHIVHGMKTRIHNTLRCVESLKLEIEDVVLGSLASAQVVVTQHQKDLGVLVIDIGGGTTDYLIYQDGAVRHSGVLALGGDHITNDISVGLKLPIARAEALKIQEGTSTDPTESHGGVITVKNDPGFLGCEMTAVRSRPSSIAGSARSSSSFGTTSPATLVIFSACSVREWSSPVVRQGFPVLRKLHQKFWTRLFRSRLPGTSAVRFRLSRIPSIRPPSG